MTKTLRKRFTLLGTTSLFAVALVAAPVQFSSVTPDLAVAQAAGGSGGSASNPSGEGSAPDAGGGGEGSSAGGSGGGSGPGGEGGGEGGPPS